MATEETKKQIQNSIQAFAGNTNVYTNALNLFKSLGYLTERQSPLNKPNFQGFKETYIDTPGFDETKARVKEWSYVNFLFQISKEDVLKRTTDFNTNRVDQTIIEAYLFFVIELNGSQYSRGELALITREINKLFAMPAMILFKYGPSLSFSIINRRLHKRDETKDVLEKITLIKDISYETPHRAHIEILFDLSFSELKRKYLFTNFVGLHNAWQSTLSISALNKKFYQDIIVWFNSAVKEIKLPGEAQGSEKHKDFSVRLIARIIFIWFLKELKVIKQELLETEKTDTGLIRPKSKGSNYYKFVLQNLFFNALNNEAKDRDPAMFDFYASTFADPKKLKDLIFFSPYLNGGLFDIHPNDWCEPGKVNNGFNVPDHLFLAGDKGINSLLARYKFTVTENTPLEEEIAVDPEMLGRIFENLLAEQSDDTRDVARKNAGAFYTPRPVVSYMCRNIIMHHLNLDLKPENSKAIIHKLLETTVLDPACGSGAFPMGMLEEMMQILTAVDPDGKIWVGEMLKSKDESFREHISEMFADGQIRYIKKLGLLRNCLFGVDLLEYAIEITKLRCWLSLIVEQKVDFSKPNYNLKPLPNLEFKFYKKNTLLRQYDGQNLNDLVGIIDNNELLSELVNLENQYFIAKSDRHGTKEEIKEKIIKLLKRIVDTKSDQITKELNSIRTAINKLTSQGAPTKEISKQKNKEKTLARKLAELVIFQDKIKDYFIERVVFPGIFNREKPNPGFDIVIGNPPYVNTKLINGMGLTEKLKEEYGYCDDLYNHFTIRGLELLKKGGLLSYITSDTFLTLQTKRNMRIRFLGIQEDKKDSAQTDLFGDFLTENMPTADENLFGEKKHVQGKLVIAKSEENQDHPGPFFEYDLCHVFEIINAPKAFAALVDTAIFSLKKEPAKLNPEVVYVDIRKPNADMLQITEEEWQQVKTSKENISGWERVLERTFRALGNSASAWQLSHHCDKTNVYKDRNSSLLKFKISLEPYRKAINFAIFSPTPYNCQILEKIIKPARSTYNEWWSRIETSREFERNRQEINRYTKTLKPADISLIGLLADGGQGLATGNNGRFVGYKTGTRLAQRCMETRPYKLWEAIEEDAKIRKNFKVLADCESPDDVITLLDEMKEEEIWELFDTIKEKHGLRIFGKGYMYRIIPEKWIFDASEITEKQKLNGIKAKRCFVPYEKGDKEGNRWISETPYLIDWSEDAVAVISVDEKARWQGYQFFFREGFCWSDVLNPNSQYIKCRLKGVSVNDVKSMSLYDEAGIGDEYLVATINSYLAFKVLREFINNTVAIQMNDIRKLPIKFPDKDTLKLVGQKFKECRKIKENYFANKIDRSEMKELLYPIEREIDQIINRLYGIELDEAITEEETELEELDQLEEDTD